MTRDCAYHTSMRPWLPASILPVLLALLFVPVSSRAQVNGTPTSVTSPGFGGRAINGTPASVTSVGPLGYSPDFRNGTPGTVPFSHQSGKGDHNQSDRGDHRRHRDSDSSPLYYAVPVPYGVDAAPQEEAPTNDDADYQGGPTVFDRRGGGEHSYVPPARDAAPAHQAERDEAPDPPSEPDPLPQTVLIFKDGHKLEVNNYAIVGSTLFDLSSGRPHKIALADLNLDSTQKENDERGVPFQVPPAKKAK